MPSIQEVVNSLAATVRRQQEQLAALQKQLVGAALSPATPATDNILRNATGLPAVPGSVWAWLAKLAWCDRDIVYPQELEFWVDLVGAVDGGGTPVDGTALNPTTPPKVNADSFFVCYEIRGYVERDPTNPNEDETSQYVNFQLEDDSRNAPFGRDTINMRTLAGTKWTVGVPFNFSDVPMAWWPDCQLKVTFSPLAGFPDAGVVSAITQRTTRRVGIQLIGMNVRRHLVDNLLNENRRILYAGQLLRQPI